MQNNTGQPPKPSIQDILRIAQTPEGKKLISAMTSRNDPNGKQAMERAAAGDYAPAKELLSQILTPEEIQTLLGRLGGEKWKI